MLTLSVGSASCSEDEPIQGTGQQVTPGNGSGSGDNGSNNNGNNPDDNDDNNDDTPVSNNLKITIGPVSFNATLDNNETAKAFKRLLPMTVDMSELHGNEKYYYLSKGLPTASSNPGTIRTGDLMLYGSTCVVLFYETFSTSYTYTRLGRITNPSGLASTLKGRVMVGASGQKPYYLVRPKAGQNPIAAIEEALAAMESALPAPAAGN